MNVPHVEARKSAESPGAGATNGHEPATVVLGSELNSGLLKEQVTSALDC